MCCGNHHEFPKDSSERRGMYKVVFGVAVSLLLVGTGYEYFNSQEKAKATLLKYSPQEVAYEHPVKTGHLHDISREKPIPFLPKTQPQPSINVPETFYDFGSVGATEVVKRTFLIRNTGKGTLTISRAFTTCGCTTAEFSSTVIPPGKVALVNVTFDAGFHDTRGHTVKRGVIIENNDPNQSKVEIWVQASVRQN